ncbi:MAG: hypothetical protein ABI807_08765 [Sporichthyaceae bacterium]
MTDHSLAAAELAVAGPDWLLAPEGHRRSRLDGAGGPLLADRHPVRLARQGAARLLGQQRPVLRHGRGSGPGVRPAGEGRTDATFAQVLVDDIERRATADGTGAGWSNHEHRVTPSELSPRRGWAMGNAGIVRELLRYVRILAGGDPAYAVTWPDHPPV